MRAFVTGGTGFIGRRLIADLLAHGYAVTALVRTFDRARSLPEGVVTTPGDVTRRASLRAGMRGADVVFHLAAAPQAGARPADRERLYRVNVHGARETLELAGELGVPKIVYTSTAAVLGDSQGRWVDQPSRSDGVVFESEHERTKFLAHYEVAVPLQQRGLPLVIVCPGAVYGPGDASQVGKLLGLYARRRLPLMLGAEGAYAWAHVDDVAGGHRLAAEKGQPGETYLLAGEALSLRQFFAAAERATGLPAPRIWLPAQLAGKLASRLYSVNSGGAERLQGKAGLTYLARADQAKRELGWQPRSVEAGMSETVAWLRMAQGKPRDI